MSEITAYHEAGHAFAAVYFGARVCSVTIEPDWDDGPDRFGDTRIEWDHFQFTQRELHQKMIFVALAGPAAEMVHSGDPYHPGLVAEWKTDWDLAWEAAVPLEVDQQKRLALLEQVSIELYRLFSRDNIWPGLAAVVDHLLACETLEGDAVHEIVSVWIS